MVKMEPPGRFALSELQQWMQSPSIGNVYLRGKIGRVWKDTKASDMLALIREESDDLLSLWIAKAARHWLQPLYTKIFKVRTFSPRPLRELVI